MEAQPATCPCTMLIHEHVSKAEVPVRSAMLRKMEIARWLIMLSVWCASPLTPLVSSGQSSPLGQISPFGYNKESVDGFDDSKPYSVVCAKEGIAGFDAEHELAIKLFPENVIGDKAMWVFVTKKSNSFYLQSNYRPNEGFSNPIKIATNESKDLKLLYSNICTDAGNVIPSFDLAHAYENNVSFIFDESVINEKGEIDLDIGSKISDKIYGLFNNRPPPKRLRKIKSGEIPPVWMAEYEPSIFAKIKVGFKPDQILDQLRKLPFQRSDMQLVSLFIDKAIENKLAKSSLKELTAKLQNISEAEIEKVFATSDAKIIVLLGHASGDSFVTQSSDNRKTLLNMSFAKIKALAEKYRKDVVYLGCNSYQAAGLGADRAFNPLLALSHLEKAVNASNLHDFLSAFSSSELGIVMDESAFANSTKKENSTNESVEESSEVIAESENGAFAFKIVRKVRNGNAKKDSYDIGQETGTVRFVTGYQALPITPPIPHKDTVVTPQLNNASLGSEINLGSDTNLDGGVEGSSKAPNWKLWSVLVAMLALTGFLFFATIGKKNKS